MNIKHANFAIVGVLAVLLCSGVQAVSEKLTIKTAAVDFDTQSLTITGVGFDTINDTTVTLGHFGALPIQSETSTQIVTSLPANLTAGNYLLTVTVTHGSSQSDEFDLTVLDTDLSMHDSDMSTEHSALEALLRALGLPPAGVRFVDNGDGTITDFQTGLMWQKQDDNNIGGPLDKDLVPTWNAATTTWLADINSLNETNETEDEIQLSFAGGYTDWRLPTIVELQTILLAPVGCGHTSTGCVFSIFDTNCVPGCTTTALDPANACSCTTPGFYFSSTSSASNPENVWFVDFNNGGVANYDKGERDHPRAVRNAR